MEGKEKKQENSSDISIGNSVICSDIWQKNMFWKLLFYVTAHEIWDNFEISWMVFLPNMPYKSCYYLFILLPATVCNFHM